jgi:hypothetical protein
VDVMVAAVVGSAVISVVGPDSSLGRDETLFARKTTVSNSYQWILLTNASSSYLLDIGIARDRVVRYRDVCHKLAVVIDDAGIGSQFIAITLHCHNYPCNDRSRYDQHNQHHRGYKVLVLPPPSPP